MSTGGPAAWLSSRVLLVFANVADTGDADAASCRDQGDKRQPLEEKKDANAEEEDDIMALRKSTAVRRSCRHTHVHAWSLRAYMEYVLYARVGVCLCPSASCLCPSLSRHARELRAQRSPLHRPRHPACVRSADADVDRVPLPCMVQSRRDPGGTGGPLLMHGMHFAKRDAPPRVACHAFMRPRGASSACRLIWL